MKATPEELWKRISTDEGIESWFAPTARFNGRQEGGEVTLSWGPGIEGAAKIHLWEEGARMGWTEMRGEDRTMTVEFQIEALGGGETKLTLVQSGFGEGGKFEDEYESTNGGWRSYFSVFGQALTVHPGEWATPLAGTKMVQAPLASLREKVAQWLGTSGPLDEIPVGGAISGRVNGRRLAPQKPGYYLIEVEEWDRSILGLFAEPYNDACFVTWQAFLYGAGKARGEQIRKDCEELLAFS